MGKIYADDLNHPTAAMTILGDFCFYAGTPSEELVSYKPAWCTQDFLIMTPQNDAWKDTIVQVYKDKAKIVTRYAMKKEPDVFDKSKLERVVSSLPNGYEIRMIDEHLYHTCKSEPWSADLVSSALAEKLGYHYSHAYTAIEICRY